MKNSGSNFEGGGPGQFGKSSHSEFFFWKASLRRLDVAGFDAASYLSWPRGLRDMAKATGSAAPALPATTTTSGQRKGPSSTGDSSDSQTLRMDPREVSNRLILPSSAGGRKGRTTTAPKEGRGHHRRNECQGQAPGHRPRAESDCTPCTQNESTTLPNMTRGYPICLTTSHLSHQDAFRSRR